MSDKADSCNNNCSRVVFVVAIVVPGKVGVADGKVNKGDDAVLRRRGIAAEVMV